MGKVKGVTVYQAYYERKFPWVKKGTSEANAMCTRCNTSINISSMVQAVLTSHTHSKKLQKIDDRKRSLPMDMYLKRGTHEVTKKVEATCSNSPGKGLDYALSEKLYGQHIAHELVVNAIRSHVNGNNRKPLVMSFHGWPGGGKNYVTKFIMKNLFKNGETDKHVHIFSGKAHFPLVEEVHLYQQQLKTWIRGNVSSCPTSMFVFDEVDKMPPSVFDSVKPYLDHHGWFDQVDFRDAIFIFLSNTGSHVITQTMIELYMNGRKREDLKLSDFEDPIARGAFNENGGLHGSDTIAGSVIDHFVPFLPLEEKHVKKCVIDAFESKTSMRPSNSDIEEVMEYITYGPEEMKIFSNSGCKRVSQKVATVVEKKRYPRRHKEL